MYKYSLNELKKLAEQLADDISAPFSVMLKGGVGAGKTTFSQFFITKLLKDKRQPVTSPTFNIIQVYDTVKGDVWHVDLYRINSVDEILELDLLEAMEKYICLIEWSELLYTNGFEKHLEKYNTMIVDLTPECEL